MHQTSRFGIATMLLLVAATSADAVVTTYTDRATFEATLDASITDDYESPPYDAGFNIYDNATMSAFLGETDYETTGFPNWNFRTNVGTYCAGCNGSFRLSFTTTSIGIADGVFGVGWDVIANDSSLPYSAFVTFGDGSMQSFALPIGASFFGVTADELVQSIHFSPDDNPSRAAS